MLDPIHVPTILAIPFHGCRAETNPILRLWHVCDLADLWLRFSVMVSLGDLVVSKPLPRGVATRVRQDLDHPTMGVWLGLARDLAAISHSSPDLLIPELPPFMTTQLMPLLDGNTKPRSAETSLTSLRNRLAHGGGITHTLAERLVDIWLPRVEDLMQAAAWLADLQLIVPHEGVFGLLRGPSPLPEPLMDSRLREGSGGRVILRRGDRETVLFPLAVFGIPQRYAASQLVGRIAVPQVYLRRGVSRLEYTPLGSEELCESEADDTASAAFLDLLGLPEPPPPAAHAFAVRDFEAAIARDAALCQGRATERVMLTDLASSAENGVHFVPGSAGAGKSFLLAAFVSQLRAEHPEFLVLAYRFAVGDERCGRTMFLQFVRERLRERRGEPTRPAGAAPPMDEVQALVVASSAVERVIFVLDGLDELATVEPDAIARTILPLAEAGGLWICAGRPTVSLIEAFADARRVFPGGELPRMSGDDVRAILLHRLGPHRKRLIGGDVETASHVANAVVDLVTARADGLPIYVKHVVDDILGGWVRLEPGTLPDLPPSLQAYHERLLGRGGVGALAMIVTPLLATLAVTLDAVTEGEIAGFLGEDGWDLLADETDPGQLVRDALGWLAPMLRAAPGSDGEPRYTLFHHSLREHMTASPTTRGPVQNARRKTLRLAASLNPSGPLRAYLLRWAIRHLSLAGDATALRALLVEPGYLAAKADIQPLEEVLDDLLAAHARLGSESTADAVGALVGLCASLARVGRFDVERVHALLTYRDDRSVYESFLAVAMTDAGIGCDAEDKRRIATAFRLRHANLLRRRGNLAESESLLLDCASRLAAETPSHEVSRELARATYDLGYIAFLRGDHRLARSRLEASAAYAMVAGDVVGAWCSRCVAARIALDFGVSSIADLEAVLHDAGAVFQREALRGDATAERWVMNVTAHGLDAAVARGDLECAKERLSALEANRFIRRYGQDLMPPYRARVFALAGKSAEAVEVLENFLYGPGGAELRSPKQEGLSRLFAELSIARASVGDADGSNRALQRAFDLPDDCGNAAWKHLAERLGTLGPR